MQQGPTSSLFGSFSLGLERVWPRKALPLLRARRDSRLASKLCTGIPKQSRLRALLLVATALSACTGELQEFATRQKSKLQTDTTGKENTETVQFSERSSLAEGSRLAELASRLDIEAIKRSSALHERSAAEAELDARRFDRFPQLVPTGSIPLNGNGNSAFGRGNPSIGIAVEQMIWDGGRLRAQLSDTELKIADATIRSWIERNDDVYEGLVAYLEISRLEARLVVFQELEANLDIISRQLETRAAGGVADRGEMLRMVVALQELKRDILSDESEIRRARADLRRLLRSDLETQPLRDLGQASLQCNRSWTDLEMPRDALARIEVERTAESEKLLKARRFPRVTLGAGSAYYSNGGWSGPGVAIQLDASDMLGLGRKSIGTAGRANTKGSQSSL